MLIRRESRLTTALVEVRKRDWAVAILTGIIAICALTIGSGEWGAHGLHPGDRARITLAVAFVALLVCGVIATRRFASLLDRLVRRRTMTSAGAAVRLVVSGVGYVFVFFAMLSVLDVSVERLLVGAGLAGVVIGIAAQQTLGNVFAGFVLLLARPFVVGDHVRIRSGALGGVFDGTVLAISLTYVTIKVEDEVLKFPNSAILAAAVGPIPTKHSGASTPATPASPPATPTATSPGVRAQGIDPDA